MVDISNFILSFHGGDIGGAIIDGIISKTDAIFEIVDLIFGFFLGLLISLIAPILRAMYEAAKAIIIWSPYPGSGISGSSQVYIFEKPPEGVFVPLFDIAGSYMEPISILFVSFGIVLVLSLSVFESGLPAINIGADTNRQKLLVAPFLILMWIPLASIILLLAAGVTDLFTTITIPESAFGTTANYSAAVNESASVQNGKTVEKLAVLGSLIPAVTFLLLSLLFGVIRAFGLLALFSVGPIAISFWAMDFKGLNMGLGGLGKSIIERYLQLAFFPVPAAFSIAMIPLLIGVVKTVLGVAGLGGLVGVIANATIIYTVPAVLAFAPLTVIIGVKKAMGAATAVGATATGAGVVGMGMAASGAASKAASSDTAQKAGGKLKSVAGSKGSALREKSNTVDRGVSGLASTARGASEFANEFDTIRAGRQTISEASTNEVVSSAAASVAGNSTLERRGGLIGKSISKTGKMQQSERPKKFKMKNLRARRDELSERFGEDSKELPGKFESEDVGGRLKAEKEAMRQKMKDKRMDNSTLAQEYVESDFSHVDSVDEMDDVHKSRMSEWAYMKATNGEMDELEKASQEELMRDLEGLQYENLLKSTDEDGRSIGLKHDIDENDTATIDGEDVEIESTRGGVAWDIASNTASDDVVEVIDKETLNEQVASVSELLTDTDMADEENADELAEELVKKGVNKSTAKRNAKLFSDELLDENNKIKDGVMDDLTSNVEESPSINQEELERIADSSNVLENESRFSVKRAVTGENNEIVVGDDIDLSESISYDTVSSREDKTEPFGEVVSLERGLSNGLKESYDEYLQRAVEELDISMKEMTKALDGESDISFEEIVSEENMSVVRDVAEKMAEEDAGHVVEMLEQHDAFFSADKSQIEAGIASIYGSSVFDDIDHDKIDSIEDLSDEKVRRIGTDEQEELEAFLEMSEQQRDSVLDSINKRREELFEEFEKRHGENLADLEVTDERREQLVEIADELGAGEITESRKQEMAKRELMEETQEELMSDIEEEFRGAFDSMGEKLSDEFERMAESHRNHIEDSINAEDGLLSEDNIIENIDMNVDDHTNDIKSEKEAVIKIHDVLQDKDVDNKLGEIEDMLGKEARDKIAHRTTKAVKKKDGEEGLAGIIEEY